MSSPVRRILEPCSSPEPAQLDGFARIHDTAADDRGTGDGAKGCWRAHDADDRRARGFSGPGRREDTSQKGAQERRRHTRGRDATSLKGTRWSGSGSGIARSWPAWRRTLVRTGRHRLRTPSSVPEPTTTGEPTTCTFEALPTEAEEHYRAFWAHADGRYGNRQRVHRDLPDNIAKELKAKLKTWSTEQFVKALEQDPSLLHSFFWIPSLILNSVFSLKGPLPSDRRSPTRHAQARAG